MHDESTVQHETLFGHPVGLYTLFFAEMWERFSYYGMRALLVFYMIKGFLGYSDNAAYGVYGAYTALVYATGFVGGMFADRLLGARRCVVLGGLLMAGGHLMMTVENSNAFYLALGLLITGNGFFKPNISTIVGKLYPAGSARKEGGFTIFYMGINLGAAVAPLICAYVGERYGWHNGFGLATIGMLVGLAVFVAPVWLTQVLILGAALSTACSLLYIQDNTYQLIVNAFAALALAAAGVIAFIALSRGGLPPAAGAPPDPAILQQKLGPFRFDVLVYLCVVLSVPVFALLVQHNRIASRTLLGFGAIALIYLVIEAVRHTKIERERLFVVIILTFFSLLFWAFFEQAGSSMGNFTDRNVDRVFEQRVVVSADVGSQITFRIPVQTDDTQLKELPLLTQEQLGRDNDDPGMARELAQAMQLLNENKIDATQKLSPEKLESYIRQVTANNSLLLTGLTALREAAKLKGAPTTLQTLEWKVAPNNIGMGISGSEIPPSMFQAANPIYILLFGLLFTMLWTYLDARGFDPSIPVKFALALLQLGLGFAVLWYGAQYTADSRGMVAMPWLLLGILLHTTGELCTSPIGLSMVSTLSPKHLVSTVMGSWFLGMAIANDLSAEIAKLTGVGGENGDGPQVIPLPIETVHIYGGVFGKIAIAAFVAALVCLAVSPLLTKWMHQNADLP
jgi:proton-dependent oligopeptide transporter, POT family